MTQPHLTQLNKRAMMVRLTISMPTTVRRDAGAEAFAQSQLADTGLRVSTALFREKTNPVRNTLAMANAVYIFHKENTLPYIDRGPRLLPVSNYDRYRDEMKKLVDDVESTVSRVMPFYNDYVQQDIQTRGGRASIADYPTADQFKQAFGMRFTFAPLPDKSHFLFDVSDEDRAALDQQLVEVAMAAKTDMKQRVAEPLKHLLHRLRAPIGSDGSIFRDTAVTNVTEAVSIVRSLAMDDPEILAMCDEVSAVAKPWATQPDVLRENQGLRDVAVQKLDAVASRMAFFGGGE